MITVEMTRRDITHVQVRNLPGSFFAGTSPLLRPFLSKLEDLLPEDKRGLGINYVLGALRSQVDGVHAEEGLIHVKSGEKAVDITRGELTAIMGDRYPNTDHHRLNLPGLLFLQSGPILQSASLEKLKEHGVVIPEGRRTQRYVFHLTVVSLEADHDRIRVQFDLDRIPRLPDPL